MQAITFHDVEELRYEAVPDPELLEPTDAVVRVTTAGLCGSDLHPYFGRETGLDVGTVMGHEMVGEVVAVGDAVEGFRIGDRVVTPFTTSCGSCFYCARDLSARCVHGALFGWVQDGKGLHGCQAELVRVPLADGTLCHVPEGLDEAVALLAGDILSTATFGADSARIQEGDVVVIVGCGPVGLLAVRAALARGAERVFAADPVASRRAAAERFGAEPLEEEPGAAISAVLEATDGRGADAAIEAAGTGGATRAAADLLRPGGRLAAVAVHTEPSLALAPGEIYDRNLTYVSGRCPARSYLPSSLETAARDEALLAELISHRLPLSDGVEAYERFAAREDGWRKVVLLP